MSRKTALVTGASSGIGLELARLLAADGYDLILTARRADLLRDLADELTLASGVAVHILPMDLARPDAAMALWQAVCAITPTVDVLINNAGFGDAGPFADAAPERIADMLQLNIAALTVLTRLALPAMLASGRGRILNVASLAGTMPGGPGMAVYYATKRYVLSFSRGIRRELRGSGVTVTALCPGPTQTGFEAAAHAGDTLLFRWNKPMPAEAVARAGYHGLQLGVAVVIPGWINRLLAASAWLAPTAIVLEINRLLLQRRR